MAPDSAAIYTGRIYSFNDDNVPNVSLLTVIPIYVQCLILQNETKLTNYYEKSC